MKCNLTVGQKVVCIIWGDWVLRTFRGYTDVDKPKKDNIYRVTGLVLENEDIYVRLQGFIDNYHHSAFRPLEERKTDIGVFTKILKNPELEIVE